MIIENGKRAKIVYKLFNVKDGSLIEEIPEEKPIVFEFGKGYLFPEF